MARTLTSGWDLVKGWHRGPGPKRRRELTDYCSCLIVEESSDELLGEDVDKRSAPSFADGQLRSANRDDPVVRELRMLYEAVAPIVQSDTIAG